jgi:hypothetical protein
MTVRFIDRRRSQCAFIVDQTELLVCGEVNQYSSGSYCPEHTAICYDRGAKKKPIEDTIHLWPQKKIASDD